jgi:serine/threonine protein kinase
MIGRMLGHYRIVEKLGSGDIGEVYKGGHPAAAQRRHQSVTRTVADDPQQIQQLEREARALVALNHPNELSGLTWQYRLGVAARPITPNRLVRRLCFC